MTADRQGMGKGRQGAGRRPRGRRRGLLVKELGDETLLYDLASHRAHCLNRTAGLVWRLADGRRDSRQLAHRALQALGTDPRQEGLVELALAELAEAGLLEQPSPGAEASGGPSRRDLLRQLGRTAALAALLPVVESIVVPTPASAATCVQPGGGCTSSFQCCSGLCSGGVCV